MTKTVFAIFVTVFIYYQRSVEDWHKKYGTTGNESI